MTNNEKALELVQKCLDDWPYAATRVFDIMKRLEQVKVLLKEQQETLASFQSTINKLTKALAEQPEQKFFVDSDGKMTPLPVQKHGYWVPINSPTGVEYGGIKEYTVREVMCSECGFTDDVSASIYTYCPECGAKMEGEGDAGWYTVKATSLLPSS